MSSETAPLLPQSQPPASKPHEHQIFLRICHATWSCVGTKTLLASRFTIAAYMISTLATALKEEVDSERDARLFPFNAGVISYTFQTVYFMIATVSVLCLGHGRWPSSMHSRGQDRS